MDIDISRWVTVDGMFGCVYVVASITWLVWWYECRVCPFLSLIVMCGGCGTSVVSEPTPCQVSSNPSPFFNKHIKSTSSLNLKIWEHGAIYQLRCSVKNSSSK